MMKLLFALSLLASWPAVGDDEDERPLEAGEVMQEGCLQGTCFRMVNTTRLTDNDEADRETARRIMETELDPSAPAPSSSSSKAGK